MRFREMIGFEVRQQLRRPSTWLYALLLITVTLLLLNGGANPVSRATVFNAPVKVATFTLFVGLLGTLVTAALFVEAGSRDVRWRMDPLFYTTPLRRRDYLGGRFAGALLVNALLLLTIPAALLLSLRLPALASEMLGPFRPGAYLLPYLLFLLPNLFVNAAVLYGVSVLTRRSLPGYLAGFALIAAYLLTVNLAGWDASGFVALADPTGALALNALTEGWTRVEQNTRMIVLEGVLLWNRLLWLAIGAAMLAFTAVRFRFAHGPRARRSRVRQPQPATDPLADVIAARADVVVPSAPRSFGMRARARQALAVAGLASRQIMFSREFLLVTVGLAGFALLMGVEMTNDAMFGMRLWPLTHEMAADLTGRTMQILIGLLTVFYAGELVWAEREGGMEKIADSAPVPDWVLFVGRFLAITLMLALLQAVLMGSGMLAQALQGYYAFQPLLYVQMLFGLRLPDYLLFAALALLIHVLVNQKYLGHVIALLLFVAVLQAGRFGIEHNLLIYGSDAGWIYSALNGLGSAIAPFVWFKLYWTGWALLLGVTALLFWVRGTEPGLRGRARLARQRVPRVAKAAAAGALLVLVSGGFVFYNTNVVNEYRSSWAADEVHAEYERRYSRFEHAAQPWLTATRLHVELYPDRREATVQGVYRLVNRTDVPIDSVHLSSFPNPQITLRQVQFDRPAGQVLEDAVRGYRIYRLERALQPGDSLQMEFHVHLAARGFRNRERASANTPIIGEFTHVPSLLLLPAIGYQRELLELSNPATRRRHGLPSVDTRPAITEPRARRVPRISPNADWISFEGTVGTAPDQIAVLPGTLQRDWLDGDRRYFHYRTQAPITSWFALLSAAYEVREASWNDVAIRVAYHPDHAFNVDGMVRNVQRSLDYFTEEFAPYPHRAYWMLEFPRYGNFARAYPGQMIYSENNPVALARMDGDGVSGIDGPLLMTAHELAHQWWGQHVLAADVRGAQVITETLAQYSAVMVLQRTHGGRAARAFLRNMQMSYLDGRGSHTTPEVPLLITGDHEYIHYRKGPVAMYTLQDYIGEDRVNAALGNLIRRHGMKGPPYATALDLYRELAGVTPDSLRYLLDDLFTSITLWDLRATGARAEPTSDGDYHVSLDIEAAKLRSDSIGNDTEVPMNDFVEIGVFGADGEPLYLRKHRIASGAQRVTVTVPGKPSRAGIDPHHKLIARHLEAMIGGKMTEVEHVAPAAEVRTGSM